MGTFWTNTSQDYNVTDETPFYSITEDDLVFEDSLVRISLVTAYSIVFVCCFFGNLIVITVVCVHRRMRTATNFFLGNLAFADICVGIFCVYQNLLLYLTNGWALGNFFCKMYHFVHGLSYTTSILILTVISVERYVVIVHTFWGRRVITLGRLKVVLALVWCLSAVYNSPRLFVYGTVNVPRMDGDEGYDTLCVLKQFHYNSTDYDLYNFVVLFAIPMAIMTVLYAIICSKLWKSGGLHRIGNTPRSTPRVWYHRISERSSAGPQEDPDDYPVEDGKEDDQQTVITYISSSSSQQSSASKVSSTRGIQSRSNIDSLGRKDSSQSDPVEIVIEETKEEILPSRQGYRGIAASRVLLTRKRIIRLLLTVVFCFAICNVPYHARKFWQNWGKDYNGASRNSVFLTISTTLIFYMNSGINPFLYAFLSTNFRQSVSDVFLCRKQVWRRNPTPMSDNRHRIVTQRNSNSI